MAGGGGRGLICAVCSVGISRYEDSLQCSVCRDYSHIICVGVSVEAFVNMNVEKTVKKWRCGKCVDITSIGENSGLNVNNVLTNDEINPSVSGGDDRLTPCETGSNYVKVSGSSSNGATCSYSYMKQRDGAVDFNSFVDCDTKLSDIIRNQQIIIAGLKSSCNCSAQILELRKENTELKACLQKQLDFIMQYIMTASKNRDPEKTIDDMSISNSVNVSPLDKTNLNEIPYAETSTAMNGRAASDTLAKLRSNLLIFQRRVMTKKICERI